MILLPEFSLIETGTSKIKKKQQKAHELKMLIRSSPENIQNLVEGNSYVIIFENVT